MKKILLFSLVFTAFLCLFTAAFAEQTPCTPDSFGCWVPAGEGKTYLRYWSEEARPYVEAVDPTLPDLTLLSGETAKAGQVCHTLIVGGQEIETCVSN